MGVRSLILKLKHHERLTTCQAHFARHQTMAHLGDIFEKGGSYFAKIDTNEKGVRYAMKGPPRCGSQAALQDLAAIRSGAAGAPTRSEGLQAMVLVAKRLRDEASVAMRGGIKTENADRMFARIQITYDSLHDEINGPPRLQAPGQLGGSISFNKLGPKITF